MASSLDPKPNKVCGSWLIRCGELDWEKSKRITGIEVFWLISHMGVFICKRQVNMSQVQKHSRKYILYFYLFAMKSFFSLSPFNSAFFTEFFIFLLSPICFDFFLISLTHLFSLLLLLYPLHRTFPFPAYLS